jgi:hypothetical protein
MEISPQKNRETLNNIYQERAQLFWAKMPRLWKILYCFSFFNTIKAIKWGDIYLIIDSNSVIL